MISVLQCIANLFTTAVRFRTHMGLLLCVPGIAVVEPTSDPARVCRVVANGLRMESIKAYLVIEEVTFWSLHVEHRLTADGSYRRQ